MTATRFTAAQVQRAIKGAIAAGLPIATVEVTAEGTIRILSAAPVAESTDEVDDWFKGRDGQDKSRGHK